MMRIALFLLTNIAVMAIVGVILAITGVGNSSSMGGLLMMCFMYGMVGSLVSLLLSKKMAKWSTKAQIITQPSNATEQWLFDTVKRQSNVAGIKMPEIGIFPSAQPNAFATGWNKNAALVAVSTGLLQRMKKEEVEAVIGHEIGHVANGDMVTLALLQGVVNAFVMFFARIIANFINSVVLKNENGGGAAYFAIVMILQIALGFLASAVVMWFSRYREYRADEAGAKLGGKQNMINALLALQHGSDDNGLPENMQAMAIAGGKISQMFSSHPLIEARVAALQAKQI